MTGKGVVATLRTREGCSVAQHGPHLASFSVSGAGMELDDSGQGLGTKARGQLLGVNDSSACSVI